MVENLFGNLWQLESGEYIEGENKVRIEGPVQVRVSDHTHDIGALSVRYAENDPLELAAESIDDFPNLVKKTGESTT